MSMTVKNKNPAQVHAAVMNNITNCNAILTRTHRVMLECAKTQLEIEQAMQTKKAGFNKANQNLKRIENAIRNLISAPEIQDLEIPAAIQRLPVGGLRNLGNTCYLNSAIQGLLASPKFVNALRAMPHQQFLNTIAETKDNPEEAVRLLSSLENLHNRITADRANPDFFQAQGAFQDAAAALEAILGDCNYTLGFQTTYSAAVAGVLSSNVNEEIKLVHLPITPNLNLQQIINAKFSPKEQNDPNNQWRATLRGGGTREITQYTITHKLANPAPDILAFQYERVDLNGYNDRAIDCPQEIDMAIAFGQPVRYRLVASINHHHPNPHYTAYVKKENVWYHCDDNQVSVVAAIPTDKAALLIFEKI